MKIVDMTATGDDNIISSDEEGENVEMEYRKKQLEKLQEEVVDLEDISGGISIMDLGLNEFRMDLLEYIKENPDIENAPHGLHTVIDGEDDGVIFILKNINKDIDIQNKNRLHPFYMVYIARDCEIVCDYLSPKEMLSTIRNLCKGRSIANKKLCKEFNTETKDGKDMAELSYLLQRAIASIIELKEENDMLSFLKGEEASFFGNDIKGIEDFELLYFFVVREKDL